MKPTKGCTMDSLLELLLSLIVSLSGDDEPQGLF